MTSVPSTPSNPDSSGQDQPTIIDADVIDLRTSRLAELVAGLTGCERAGALHAIRTGGDSSSGDALELVARAMVDVDQPPPDGFRLAGFMRNDIPLAHHGSLRRWDRGESRRAPLDPG